VAISDVPNDHRRKIAVLAKTAFRVEHAGFENRQQNGMNARPNCRSNSLWGILLHMLSRVGD
jgi:hypothetical protein